MTHVYHHELTPTEMACGVSLEQVAGLLPKVLLFDGGTAVALPESTPPALASSTARCALKQPAVFAGFNQLGHPVYRKSTRI